MSSTHKWIETYGGPHILLPEELRRCWRGIEGWRNHNDPEDLSDYARACRVKTWLGALPCNGGTALVLSGDVGAIAWIPGSPSPPHEGGFLVQWLGIDDEGSIEPTLRGEHVANLLNNPRAEALDFDTGPSGVLRLFDSADRGDDLMNESQLVLLRRGTYRIRAACFDSPGITMVVRGIARI